MHYRLPQRLSALCLSVAFFSSGAAQANSCPSIAASLYTSGSVTGWDPFAGPRCKTLLGSWQRLGVDAVTFVIEHYGFGLTAADEVIGIPPSAIPRASLERCFATAFELGLDVNLKLQLPDTAADSQGKFRWRHYYKFDFLGEYDTNLVAPYLEALIAAARAHQLTSPQARAPRVKIYPLHELHVMLCERPEEVGEYTKHLRKILSEAGFSDWKIGVSLDWQFFTDVTPTWDGDVHDVCLRQRSRVGPVLGALDFIGVGAYKPSGGVNGKIDSAAEGRAAFDDLWQDVTTTLEAYNVSHVPVGIAEWNGGGAQPNTWGPPAKTPYRLAFQGFLPALVQSSAAFFTFWNVRATDAEATRALSLVAPTLRIQRAACPRPEPSVRP